MIMAFSLSVISSYCEANVRDFFRSSDIYIYIYIYILDPEKFDLRIYIYVGHFEFSWVNYTRTHTSNVARIVYCNIIPTAQISKGSLLEVLTHICSSYLMNI
jgi:hypothetical protein